MLLNYASCDTKNQNYSFTELFKYENVYKDQAITGIYLLSETEGILLGEDSRECGIRALDYPAIVLKSEDGGKTFVRQSLGIGKLCEFNISADKKRCYIIQSVHNSETGRVDTYHIWYSADKGKSWDKLYTMQGQKLLDVLFYDEHIGFISTQDKTSAMSLYKTTDGGKSWSLLPSDDVTDRVAGIITTDGFIIGWYLSQTNHLWKMNIRTGCFEDIKMNIPDNYIVNSIRQNASTHECYALCREKEWSEECRFLLYNINTASAIHVDFPIRKFHTDGDHISAVGWERGNDMKKYYFYSNDAGRIWNREVPRCTVLSQYGLYSNGAFWSIAEVGGDLVWPLMVREVEKDKMRMAE